MVIGITGGIGAGKSTVAKFMATRGARVINADQVAREVVKPETKAWREIVDRWGKEVLHEDGTLNRRKLGRIVFRDPEQLEELNKITHPPILRIIKERLAAIRKSTPPGPVIVLDAPLLIECGLVPLVDVVILVTAPDELRLKRLLAQGFSRAEAEERMLAQGDDRDSRDLADCVIENTGSLKALHDRVAEIWDQLNLSDRARAESKH